MNKWKITHTAALALATSLTSGMAQATLQGRDLDGNGATFEAYYDTVLDITWLADANLAASKQFGAGGLGRINGDGTIRDWDVANEWLAAMNAEGGTGYLGFNDWRLPTVKPINGVALDVFTRTNNATSDDGYADADGWVDGFGSPVSEMGHLFYATLGNLGFCTPNGGASSTSCVQQAGHGLVNSGPFTNIETDIGFDVNDDFYWTGSEFNSGYVMDFHFSLGLQSVRDKSIDLVFHSDPHVWVVRDGDVAVVPEPETWGLMLSGLALVCVMARRRS